MNTRVERLVAELEKRGIPGMLVSTPENRRYLSGFTGSAGVLIITPSTAKLATDFRYYEQVREQAPDFALVEVPQQMPRVLAAELRTLGLTSVAFESQDLTVETYNQWSAAMEGVDLIPTSGIVEGLRAVKEPAELEAIERAVSVSDAAITYIMDTIRPGMTEREVSWALRFTCAPTVPRRWPLRPSPPARVPRCHTQCPRTGPYRPVSRWSSIWAPG